MPFIENRQEFFARQDCEHVVGNGCVFFENGAFIGKSGTRYDPSADPQQLAQVRHGFFAARLVLRKSEWRGIYEAIDTQNSWHAMGVGPTADQHFHGWQEVLDRLDKEIAELEKQVLQLEGSLPKRAFEEAYRKRRDTERRIAAQCESLLSQYAIH